MPPVTALRSPPDSRITGALSPVMTDSSTVAMPSMTSPSPGTNSPVLHSTTSPARSFEEGTLSLVPSGSRRWAVASLLVLRSVSAWALPRASAMASAKVANSTVNHSQIQICSSNPRPAAPVTKSRIRNAVVRAAPTSTTKMTGFFINVTGFSLPNEAPMARRRSSGSNRGRARAIFFGMSDVESSIAGGITGVVMA